MKKSLAHNKKGRHPPIAPAPRDNPNVARRAAANAVRATALANLTPLPIVGCSHEASHPPAQHVPVASAPTLTGHTGSSAHPISDNYGNPLTPIAFRYETLEDRAKNEPVKTPFFSAFTKSDGSMFTFGSSLPPTAKPVDATLDWIFQAPVTKSSPSEKGSVFSGDSTRSIFEVLGKCQEVKICKTTSEQEIGTEPCKDGCISSPQEESDESNESSFPPTADWNDDAQRQTELQLPLAFKPEMDSSASAPVSATMEAEFEIIEQSELESTAQQHDSTDDEAYSQDMALGLHESASPLIARINLQTIVEPWQSERMFFADTEGFTRLVDMSQTLYDIAINNDDVNSDFDSIASPNKPVTSPTSSIASSNNFESPLRTVQDAEMTSSEDSEDEIHIERLFFANTTGHTRVVDLTQPMYDVDIMIDDGASDFDSEYSPIKSNASPRKLDSPLKFHDEAVMSSSEDVDEDIDIDGLLESFRVDCAYLTQQLVEAEREVTPDTDLSFSEDEDVIDPCLEFISKEVTVVDVPEDARSSELGQTTLGTESLSTFLSHLQADNNGAATKLAIAETFLKLVSLEREKLGRPPLPASYTAGAVMASEIMPHTIFLGTNSLAKFLSHFGDEAHVDEVHRMFGMLSAEIVRLRTVATTELIAALGRRLGRIWSL